MKSETTLQTSHGIDIHPVAILILVLCSDGNWRPSPLNPNQAKRVKGFIRQEQGGTIKVRSEALTVEEMAKMMTETTAAKQPTQESPKNETAAA